MKTGKFTLGFAYLRLSNEEAQGGESSSITNQRMIVQNYCKQNGITLVREFVDDGYSGGNFNRPGFKEMLRQLEQGKANLVITKDECDKIELKSESPQKWGFCDVSSVF